MGVGMLLYVQSLATLSLRAKKPRMPLSRVGIVSISGRVWTFFGLMACRRASGVTRSSAAVVFVFRPERLLPFLGEDTEGFVILSFVLVLSFGVRASLFFWKLAYVNLRPNGSISQT